MALRTRMLLLPLAFIAVSGLQTSWNVGTQQLPLARACAPSLRSAGVVALAKKKAKARKPTSASSRSDRPPPARPDQPAAPLSSSPATGPSSSSPLESRLDDALRNAGVTRTAAQAQAEAQGPTDPLSKIPKQGQEILERFFGGGAIVFGSAFILSGIAVSVEAVCKVIGKPLPTALDEVLVQYVEPALTPSILILFGFSISLGLLKQLQLGSEQAGVLYLEDDD